MSNRSGLLALRDGVADYFRSLKLDYVVGKISRHAYDEWINQAPSGAGRVLFLQPKGGARGKLHRGHVARNPPGALLQWDRPVTMSVWAADSTALGTEDEESRHLEAVERLLELTIQGIRRAVDPETGQAIGFGAIEFGDVTEIDNDRELYFGCELQVSMVLKGPLFDIDRAVVQPKPIVNKPTSLHDSRAQSH